MTAFGLETEVVDAAARDRAVARFRDAGIALPTFAQLADPTLAPPSVSTRLAAHRRGRRGRREPLPRPLVQRGRPHLPSRSTRPPRRSTRADRDRRHDRARVRQPIPDDRCAQGAGRVRVPRPSGGHRPVRPDCSSRDLALDRQLRARRRRDLADHGLPGCGSAAREHEPGALRVARGLGERSRRHRAHAGVGEQRQGDLRRVRSSSNATRRTWC